MMSELVSPGNGAGRWFDTTIHFGDNSCMVVSIFNVLELVVAFGLHKNKYSCQVTRSCC